MVQLLANRADLRLVLGIGRQPRGVGPQVFLPLVVRGDFQCMPGAVTGLAGAYGIVVALHATWNLQPAVQVSILVAATSLLLWRRQLRRIDAEPRRRPAAGPAPPAADVGYRCRP